MKKLLFSLALITVVAGATVMATRAYFTSQDVLGTNTLSTGTLRLDLNGENTKIVGLGNITGMVPGDVSDTGIIRVNNVGTENFAWAGKFILSGDAQLPKVIYIKEMQMEFLRPNQSSWEPTDKFIENGVGTGLYFSYYNSLADSDPLDVITLDTWNNHYNGMIPSGPYFFGALKPGYSYRLTFKLAMHESAGDQYMGRTMGLGFQANATQIDATAITNMFTALGTPYDGINQIAWLNTQIGNQN